MNYRDEAWLRKKYWSEGLDLRQVAQIAGTCPTTIYNWMRRHGIDRRPSAREGKSNGFFGKTHSPEAREKIKRANLGANNHNWKGGRYLKDGYVHIKAPGHPSANKKSYISEHRLIAEKALGRYLTEKEHVHHINGIRDDNRLVNLQLVTRHHQQQTCPHCGWPMGNLQEYVDRNEGMDSQTL